MCSETKVFVCLFFIKFFLKRICRKYVCVWVYVDIKALKTFLKKTPPSTKYILASINFTIFSYKIIRMFCFSYLWFKVVLLFSSYNFIKSIKDLYLHQFKKNVTMPQSSFISKEKNCYLWIGILVVSYNSLFKSVWVWLMSLLWETE